MNRVVEIHQLINLFSIVKTQSKGKNRVNNSQ